MLYQGPHWQLTGAVQVSSEGDLIAFSRGISLIGHMPVYICLSTTSVTPTIDLAVVYVHHEMQMS